MVVTNRFVRSRHIGVELVSRKVRDCGEGTRAASYEKELFGRIKV